MTAPENKDATVAKFPLVGSDASQAAGLVAVIRRLAVVRSLSELMEVVTHAARALLHADGVTFVLREGDLCHYADEDAIAPLWKGQRFPMQACISGWVMEHGTPVAIPDIYQDPRIPQDAYRPTFVKSLAMAPVRQEAPIAALGAYWSQPHEATAAEIDLLQTLANAASLGVALLQSREAVEPARGAEAWRRRAAQVRRLFSLRAGRIDPLGLGGRVLIGLGLAALAWVVRGTLHSLMGDESPYMVFIVGVLISSIVGGWVGGLTATLVSGLAANLSFAGEFGRLQLGGAHLWTLLAFVNLSLVVVLVAETMTRALQREATLNARLEVVGRELQHRIKNVISIAQALARLTSRNTPNLGEFERKFGERLEALAGAQVLLAENGGERTDLGELVSRVLAPFHLADQLDLAGGPRVQVDEQVAVAMALLLNELATNALKYGALSQPQGRVALAWTQDGERVRIEWAETGGPPVAPPQAAGFGSRLMRSALPRARGGVRVRYEPAGVRCEIHFTRR